MFLCCVIPAKAGIHFKVSSKITTANMDTGFHRYDKQGIDKKELVLK